MIPCSDSPEDNECFYPGWCWFWSPRPEPAPTTCITFSLKWLHAWITKVYFCLRCRFKQWVERQSCSQCHQSFVLALNTGLQENTLTKNSKTETLISVVYFYSFSCLVTLVTSRTKRHHRRHKRWLSSYTYKM